MKSLSQKKLLVMSFKNLGRYKKRTLITATAIGVGLCVYLLIDSLLMGMAKESERNMIRYEFGSAAFFNREYWDEREYNPIDLLVEDPQGLEKQIGKLGIKSTKRAIIPGEMLVYKDPFPEDGTFPIVLTAINLETDDDIFHLRNFISEGRYPQRGELEVVIGQWLANDIGATVGSDFTFLGRTAKGYYQTLDLTIVGLVSSENPVVNRSGVYLPLGVADEMFDLEGQVTGVFTALSEPFSKKGYREEAKELKSLDALANQYNLSLYDWRFMGSDFLAIASTKEKSSQMILVLIFLVAAVGISNTLLMSIYERFKEIGMLRAIGMSGREIRFMFIYEAMGIGLLGSLIGIGLGALINIPLVNVGIDYSDILASGDMGYRITAILRGIWRPESFLKAFVLGVILPLIIAIKPSKRAVTIAIPRCLKSK